MKPQKGAKGTKALSLNIAHQGFSFCAALCFFAAIKFPDLR
ncbi:MAG: hypothetical protein AAB466_08765 [Verrucomicrobiota bacterium]